MGLADKAAAVPGNAGDGPVTLLALFWQFLIIGGTTFGGFMALISVLQQVFVHKRRLLTHEEMLDGISLATLLPGPIAVNVVAFIGHRLRGVPGATVSMFAVILPSFLMVLALSAFYFRYGEIPAVNNAFAGFLPAVTAIIVAAVWSMGRKTIKGPVELTLAVAAATMLPLVGGFYVTLAVIGMAGALGWIAFHDRTESAPTSPPAAFSWISPALTAIGLGAVVLLFLVQPDWVARFPIVQLIATFGGISLLLFGGGFVFIPLIQEIVVGGMHWVTQTEFAAGIALGQITPGPILLSAAFIGFKVQGIWGALVATVAIFTPSAILMVTAARMLDRIKGSKTMQASMRGIRAAIVGMILAAAVVIGQTVAPHWLSVVIFGAALLALMWLKLEAVWIIPAAGILGVLFY